MTLRRAQFVLAAGTWPAHEEIGTVTLAWDERHRRRIRLSLDGDVGDVLLDLKQTARLGEGDGLLLEDGGIVRVIAAPEPLLAVRAGGTTLARLAYHLGNRHLPVQIGDAVLLIRRDHVIEEMLHGLGAAVEEVELPFIPEPGAYGGGHSHDHDHDHDDPHEHHHD
jgi:urease accessory protein